MDNFPSIAIILLTAIIHATFQLGQGTLLLLYHASLGKHIKKRTRELTRSYVIAVFLMSFLVLSATHFTINHLFGCALKPEEMLILIAILVILAVLVWIFYYRTGKSTELWLPKTVARYITSRAKVTESKTESFALGLLASLAEMPFTIVLSIIATNSIFELPFHEQIWAALCYSLIAVAPLLIMKIVIRNGKTVADIQKWRRKNKVFLEFITCASILALAAFLLAFRVMGKL